VLKNADIHAHNSFEHPDVVAETSEKMPSSSLGGGPGGGPSRPQIRYVFAPASVTKLSISLG
jgi:hypothetical protein